jgi:hypothetical protein
MNQDAAEKLRKSDNPTNEFQMNRKTLDSAGLRERHESRCTAEKLRKSDNPTNEFQMNKKRLESAGLREREA